MRWFHLACGAEVHPFELHQALLASNLPIDNRDALLERTADGTPTRPLPRHDDWWPAIEALDLARVRTILEHASPDLRHAHGHFALHFADVLAR